MTPFHVRAALVPWVAAAFLVACGDADHPPPPPIGESGTGPIVPPIVEVGGHSSAGTAGAGGSGTNSSFGGTSPLAGFESGGRAGFDNGSGGFAGIDNGSGGFAGSDSTFGGTANAGTAPLSGTGGI
jgi:hypothetical protein